MATFPSFAATTANLHSGHHHVIFWQSYCLSRAYTVRCNAKNPTNNSSTKQDTVPENNVLLKAAWYGSELLGIAASLLRSPTIAETKAPEGNAELSSDGWSGVVDRSLVVDTIKDDFLRSYFVTGKLTVDAYEEDCEFADSGCMKLMKWEDFEVISNPVGEIKETESRDGGDFRRNGARELVGSDREVDDEGKLTMMVIFPPSSSTARRISSASCRWRPLPAEPMYFMSSRRKNLKAA